MQIKNTKNLNYKSVKENKSIDKKQVISNF